MYYPLSSSSSFIVFFLFSLFYYLPCASSKQGLGWCEALFQCGNITAEFPFWGGNRHKPCGHPSLELHCNNNITSLFISNQEFYVLQIDQTSKTLTLARKDLLGSFCSATFNTATLPPEIFELSPTYKSLTVLYDCDPKLPYRSSYTCPALRPFSMSQSLYYNNSCQESFTVNVPTRFVAEEGVKPYQVYMRRNKKEKEGKLPEFKEPIRKKIPFAECEEIKESELADRDKKPDGNGQLPIIGIGKEKDAM